MSRRSCRVIGSCGRSAADANAKTTPLRPFGEASSCSAAGVDGAVVVVRVVERRVSERRLGVVWLALVRRVRRRVQHRDAGRDQVRDQRQKRQQDAPARRGRDGGGHRLRS